MKKNKKDSFIDQSNEKQINDNKSEKKSKTFIIHSRHGSVKDKNEKNYEKLNNSKYSSKKSRNSEYDNQYGDSEIHKNEMAKLSEQILILQ